MSGTIGNFDGLHLGHQAILNQVIEKANESSSASLVFFTEPHASEYFASEGMKTLCLHQEFVLGEKKLNS